MRNTVSALAAVSTVLLSMAAFGLTRPEMILFYFHDMSTSTAPVSEATAIQAAKEFTSGTAHEIFCPASESASVLPCTVETITLKDSGSVLGYAVRFGDREIAFVRGMAGAVLCAKQVMAEVTEGEQSTGFPWDAYAGLVRYGTLYTVYANAVSNAQAGQ